MNKKVIIALAFVISIFVSFAIYFVFCVQFSSKLIEDNSNKYIENSFYLFGKVVERDEGIYKIQIISYYQNPSLANTKIDEYVEFTYNERKIVFVSYSNYIHNDIKKTSKNIIFRNIFDIEIIEETITNYQENYNYFLNFEKASITTLETKDQLEIGSNYYFDISNNGIERIDENRLLIKEQNNVNSILLLKGTKTWYKPDYVYTNYKPIKVLNSISNEFVPFELEQWIGLISIFK